MNLKEIRANFYLFYDNSKQKYYQILALNGVWYYSEILQLWKNFI